MGYSGNAPKDITITDPDGSTVAVSLLDDYQQQLRRVLIYGNHAIVTKTDSYALTDADCHVIFNGDTKTATLPQISTVANASTTKFYAITNIHSTSLTIAKNASDDTLPITSLAQNESVILFTDTNPATDIWRVKSFWTPRLALPAQASGLATLNGSSKVVQDPASAGSGNGLDADKVDTYHASATAAANTIVVSDSAGRADWYRVAFSAYKTANQTSIADNTWTKVTFGTEDFDTDDCFATSTFTPNKAGKYLLSCCAYMTADSSNAQSGEIAIYKNGGHYISSFHSLSGIDGVNAMPALTVIVDANGTTDYFEVYARMNVVSGTFGIYPSNTRDVFFCGYRCAI